MHVGMSVIFQGSDDPSADANVWKHELALADQAEALGFDSIWAVEHHFTSYTMCPDPLQFLTYMAARTSRVKLGSMVVVLPWHDPVRVVEAVTMLDVMSNGRFVFGVGRGLGRVEFGGFRIPMHESRDRFVEAAEIIMHGLEHGHVEYDGTHYTIPRREIRPAPIASFRGRTYAAAVSPESFAIMAKLGVGLLIIPQKPWEVIASDLEAYNAAYIAANDEEPPAPIAVGWTFVDRDPGRARDLAHRYIGGYYDTVARHYELLEGHLSTTKGYEFYGKLSENLQKHGTQGGADFFTDLQVHGTPAQCLEKIEWIRERTGCDTYVGVCSYAGMPYDEVDRNFKLFAGDVMPVLKQWAPARAVTAC